MKRIVDNRDGTWSLILDTAAFGRIEVSSCQKRTIAVERRLVYLGWEYEEVVDPIALKDEDGFEHEVRGWTDDEEVVVPTLRMLELIDVEEIVAGEMED